MAVFLKLKLNKWSLAAEGTEDVEMNESPRCCKMLSFLPVIGDLKCEVFKPAIDVLFGDLGNHISTGAKRTARGCWGGGSDRSASV